MLIYIPAINSGDYLYNGVFTTVRVGWEFTLAHDIINPMNIASLANFITVPPILVGDASLCSGVILSKGCRNSTARGIAKMKQSFIGLDNSNNTNIAPKKTKRLRSGTRRK